MIGLFFCGWFATIAILSGIDTAMLVFGATAIVGGFLVTAIYLISQDQ